MHGGWVACAFDEILGIANIEAGNPGMTARLTIHYRKPTPLFRELRIRAWVDRVEGRRIMARGEMWDGETLTAEADGIFVQPRPELAAEYFGLSTGLKYRPTGGTAAPRTRARLERTAVERVRRAGSGPERAIADRPARTLSRMALPEHGLTHDDILDALAAKRARDARWQDGRTFGMVYDGGPEVHAIAEAVAHLYLHENALNTFAFPSLGEIQSEVVRATADLFHGGPDAAGFMTSGGTESILMGVKAARERARAERGITAPEMVIPESAHAAFHKAAHYFGVRVHKVPVADDWRADVDADGRRGEREHRARRRLRAAVPAGRHRSDSRPRATRGGSAGASMHVDACMGGFVLPFMELNGESRAAVGLPRRRRDDDLGRHPQARLRAQGRVGHPASHEGAASLPDVRVRRLARRVLRVTEHARHPLGAPDGDRMGRDAPPRHRRLPAAHASHRRCRARDDRRRASPFRVCACSANPKRTW